VVTAAPGAVAPQPSAARTLQRRFGNQGTQALLRARLGGGERASPVAEKPQPAIERQSGTATLQTSSRDAISQAGDALEQEAERVADQVMRMPHLPAPVATERASVLQRSAAGAAVHQTVPPIVHEVLRSTGRPLDRAARAFMEPRFGQDFGGVRVHTDTKAAQSAEAVDARAYTVGQDVVFGSAQYNPNTQSGRTLLAHELVHTVQQGGHTRGTSVARAPGPTAGARNQNSPAHVINTKRANDTADQWLYQTNANANGGRAWLEENWSAYLSYTSENPRLGYLSPTVHSVFSNAFGNALSDIFKNVVEKAVRRSITAVATAIGTAIEPGIGSAIGFVIGVLIETLAGEIYDAVTGKTEAEEAAAQAALKAGKQIGATQHKLNVQIANVIGTANAFHHSVRNRIYAAKTQGEVDQIMRWLEGELKLMQQPPDLKDLSLYRQLMHDWILEHAGDEEHADKDTQRAQWLGALEQAKKEGILPKGEDLDNHPETFAYQTRGHWAAHGIPGEKEANEMIRKVKELVKGAGEPSKVVLYYFDKHVTAFLSTPNPPALIRFINENNLGSLVEKGENNIRKNQFVLWCTLDLSSSDGSVYVDEWEYHLKLTGEIPWYAVRDAYFNVSPD
jgi:hypothetical protein